MSARRLARGAGVAVLVVVTALAIVRVAAAVRENDAAMPAGLALVETPLGRVAVDRRGPAYGTPVLIVPGTAGWSGFWRDVAAHLANRGYRVLAVDLPPFGWSDRDPAGRYDRSAQAIRLAGVLAAEGRPVIVVAHSFGAGPAAELTVTRPDLVARLVLVDAALGRLDPPTPGGIAPLRVGAIAQPLVAATLTNPHALPMLSRSMLARKEAAAVWHETLRAPMRRPGTTAAYAAWLPSLLAADDGAVSRRSDALASLRIPVRLIWGTADTVTPLAQGEALARVMHAPLTPLPGVGHVPHIEDPGAFLAALDAALADPAPFAVEIDAALVPRPR